jgi:hypothetical protein
LARSSEDMGLQLRMFLIYERRDFRPSTAGHSGSDRRDGVARCRMYVAASMFVSLMAASRTRTLLMMLSPKRLIQTPVYFGLLSIYTFPETL